LRDLARKLHEYYGVANSPPVEGRAAADACRALRQALEVVEADEGTHAYIQGNFPVGRHSNLRMEERIEQAVKQFEQARQVNGQYVNQVLECLYVLLDVGKLKSSKLERTFVDKAVDRLKGKPTAQQLEDHEEGMLKDVGPKLDFLVIAYNRDNPA
jgi:arginyl-tRNA synthetase